MIKHRFLTTTLILLGLGLFAYFNSLPYSSNASVGGMDAYVLYGIDSSTGELERFGFASGLLQTIGVVRDASGRALTGIEASAYIPGFANIYGFWRDPEDGRSKLMLINAKTAGATPVGVSLGSDTITGATAIIDNARYRVFALLESSPVDFEIAGGTVAPTQPYAVKVQVLGASITYDGGYDLPVTLKLEVGGTEIEPFGSFDRPLDGNVNDHANPRSYVLPQAFDPGAGIKVISRSWVKKDGQTGDQNDHWREHITVDSAAPAARVYVLRNGDDLPDLPVYRDPGTIVDFIGRYVHVPTGKVVLEPNQAIYLIELGNAAPSDGPDCQDLALLVTVANEPSHLEDHSVSGVALSGRFMVSPSNGADDGFTLIEPDGTAIKRQNLQRGLVVSADGTYYEGKARSISVTPKGDATQDTLRVDANPYRMSPNRLHTISGSGLTARIYNDQVSANGHPIGQWWVEIQTPGSVGVVDQGSYTPPVSRLVEVNHLTGQVAHVMDLERSYCSLASESKTLFYGFSGMGLYAINIVAGTETLVGIVAGGRVEGLEYAGSDLFGFDKVTDVLAPLDPGGVPVVGPVVSLGKMRDLGTIIIMPLGYDPALYSTEFE